MDASAQIVSKIQIGRSSQSLSGPLSLTTDCLHVLEEEVNGRQAVCFWKVCGLPVVGAVVLRPLSVRAPS